MSDINFRKIDMDPHDANLTLVFEDPPYGPGVDEVKVSPLGHLIPPIQASILSRYHLVYAEPEPPNPRFHSE